MVAYANTDKLNHRDRTRSGPVPDSSPGGGGGGGGGSTAWGDITDTPTTLAGYGITDAQPLDGDLSAIAALSGTGYARRTGTSAWSVSTTIPWSALTSTPTTLAGYGITDAQPLDGDLTAIAALSTVGYPKRTGASTWAIQTLADVAETGNAFDVDFISTEGLTSIDVGSALDELKVMVDAAGGGPVAAEDVSFDPTASGMTATDVQAAIDELRALIGGGPSGYDPETDDWIAGIDAVGGTYETDSKAIADALIIELNTKSYASKIIYLNPFLGADIKAARMPLRDSLGVGIASNIGFVDADFSQATGLQGDGTSKYLNSKVKGSQLGISNNGGLGWWETNFTGSGNTQPIGSYNSAGSNRYILDLRTSFRSFRWGNPGNDARDNTAAVNGHYYGQRSAANLRKVFLDGLPLQSETSTDGTSGLNEEDILLCGCEEGTGVFAPWPGRGAVAYMTDGTMSDADCVDFDQFLIDFLMTPTGR